MKEKNKWAADIVRKNAENLENVLWKCAIEESMNETIIKSLFVPWVN